MLSRGYSIIPVNPNITSVFGIKAVPSLSAITTGIDIVNVFRRAEHIPGIVEESLARHVPTLWLQTGIVHPEATTRASEAGMNVIVDRCIRVVSSLLLR
jgi:predicted CoA-binding protein